MPTITDKEVALRAIEMVEGWFRAATSGNVDQMHDQIGVLRYAAIILLGADLGNAIIQNGITPKQVDQRLEEICFMVRVEAENLAKAAAEGKSEVFKPEGV